MYLLSVIVLLFVAQLNVESKHVVKTYEYCRGGYCVPKHFCPTGTTDELPILGQNGLQITLRVNEENECGDFMMICCKKSERRPNDECGISNPQGLVYNVESNLTYAKYGEFPWTVAIFQKSSESDSPELTHVGGGTLIHPRFVLMAAHTLKDSHRYVARFGEWNMKSNFELHPTQDIEIKKYILHQLYRESTLSNDIALAVLEKRVAYSEHIRPICLPRAQDVFDSQRCIATGWGFDIRTGKPPSIMKRMEMNVIPRARCEMIFSELRIKYQLHTSVMCVEAAKDQNTCFRDGGSPLACQRDDGSYVLAAIASWVVYCDQLDFPGGHVNVAKFASWIHGTIAINEGLHDDEESNNSKNVDDECEVAPLQMQ